MPKHNPLLKNCALVLVIALFLAPDARAYIDPNSAGVLYQIFFPIIIAITMAWRWIKDMFKLLWSILTRRVG